MDKVKVDENLRELVSTNLDGIDAMQKNSPEIYSAFEKLLTAIDTKYGSGLATKNLGYLGYVSQQNTPTGNSIPLQGIVVTAITWSGAKKHFFVHSWAQLENALDFLYYALSVNLGGSGNPNNIIKLLIKWEQGAELSLDLQFANYMQKTTLNQTLNKFIEEALNRGAMAIDDLFEITSDKSMYINFVGKLDFQLIRIPLIEFNYATVNGIGVKSWLELQTWILNKYQTSTNTFEIFIAWKDKRGSFAQINFNLNEFLLENNFKGTVLSAPTYIGYVILYDILRHSFGFQIPIVAMPLMAMDVDTKLGGGIFDYDFGNGYEIYREIEKANSTLLKVNNPSTTTTQPTQKVTLKKAKTMPTKSVSASSYNSYLGTSGWTLDWKLKGLRPSPTRSASKEKMGAIGLGNDGQFYEIKADIRGVKRWNKMKSARIENIKPTYITNKDDLILGIDILENMALDQNLDIDDINEIKNQQTMFAYTYDRR
jgi:hypothetical protein